MTGPRSGRARVAVVHGGNSAEAEVSRRSATGVEEALQQAGYLVALVALDSPTLTKDIASCDVVFPVAHGQYGEDGCLQGLLEILGTPYVGSGVRASAIAAYKPLANAVFRRAGLPAPTWTTVLAAESPVSAASRILAELPGPVVVKPASGGSAIGVVRFTEAPNGRDLAAAIEAARMSEGDVVVQRYVAGDEVTCGVLERVADAPEALPVTRVLPTRATWYDFQARYSTGGSRHECPAPYDDALTRRIREVARAAHLAVGARDLSRADFVVTPQGSVHLLEVNTLPGMTKFSNFPEAAGVVGIDFPALCALLVEAAMGRPRPSLHTPEAFPD